MKGKSRTVSAAICFSALLLLIFDGNTASTGAKAGLELCIKVLIPSLFPFILTITYANTVIAGQAIPGFHLIGRILNIPSGGESILFLGFLGGYPVGAKSVYDQFRNEQITRQTAQILLGYCNNAGPAFIFGITSFLFSSKWTPIFLWMTHIISAIITGYILPKPIYSRISPLKAERASLSSAMQSCIRTCAVIGGWVITFKILEAYLEKWLTDSTNPMLMYILQGALELSNGCIALQSLNNEALRYILVSGFLAFGGICVLLQTASVTKELGLGLYVPGKIIQTAVSFILAALFSADKIPTTTVLAVIVPSLISIFPAYAVAKKRCGNSAQNHV